MRVVEPKTLAERKRKRDQIRKRQKRTAVAGALIVILGGLGAGWLLYGQDLLSGSQNEQSSTGGQSDDIQTEQSVEPVSKEKTLLKEFSGDQFRDLYRSVNYPNVSFFTRPPEITGDEAADMRIRQLAEERGFVLTSRPVTAIAKTNEPLLADSQDDLLQPLALKSWQTLKKEAEEASIPLLLTSAYRSPQRQRELFLERLFATGVNTADIVAGRADDEISTTLGLTAVPGYSRHHTGYTVDMFCDDGTGNFGDSSCYAWLKQNNYEFAKKHGWIPSYPEDAKEQGPEPEPWEYVWVGTDHLYQK